MSGYHVGADIRCDMAIKHYSLLIMADKITSYLIDLLEFIGILIKPLTVSKDKLKQK